MSIAPELAEQSVADFAHSFPDAHRLAGRLCLAVTIDVGLLRNVRLDLQPPCPLTAEIELWMSPLVARRGADRISLEPEARRILARELIREKPQEYDAAWRQLAEAATAGQRAVSPLVMVEEELFYLRMLGRRGKSRASEILTVLEQRARNDPTEEFLYWSDGLLRRLGPQQHEAATGLRDVVTTAFQQMFPDDVTPATAPAPVVSIEEKATAKAAASDESPEPDEELERFERRPVMIDGTTKTVFRTGDGPGVILLSDAFGITSSIVDIADQLASTGFTVELPELFRAVDDDASSLRTMLQVSRIAVSGDLALFTPGKTARVAGWLRHFANQVAQDTRTGRIGIIGVGVTGSAALAVAVEQCVAACILIGPSTPVPLGSRRRSDPGLSVGDLAQVKARVARELRVLGIRNGDGKTAVERFDRLRTELGDSFETYVTEPRKDKPADPTALPPDAIPVMIDFLHQHFGK